VVIVQIFVLEVMLRDLSIFRDNIAHLGHIYHTIIVEDPNVVNQSKHVIHVQMQDVIGAQVQDVRRSMDGVVVKIVRFVLM